MQDRVKHYPYRPKANPGFFKGGKRSNKFFDRIDDPGGVGKEITKELDVCEICAKQYGHDA